MGDKKEVAFFQNPYFTAGAASVGVWELRRAHKNFQLHSEANLQKINSGDFSFVLFQRFFCSAHSLASLKSCAISRQFGRPRFVV